MFVMAHYAYIYIYIRYAVTNMQRLFEERRVGHITGPVMAFSVSSDILGMASISVFSQVWEVDPWMSMYGHTLSFIGFIYVRFVSVLAMMPQCSGASFKGWVFLVFYRVVTAMLLIYYLSSFAYFTITSHDVSDTLLPWWVGMSMDYAWVGGLLSSGLFIHIVPVYKVAMLSVMKHSVKDDIENVGTLLVQNSTTDSLEGA